MICFKSMCTQPSTEIFFFSDTLILSHVFFLLGDRPLCDGASHWTMVRRPVGESVVLIKTAPEAC